MRDVKGLFLCALLLVVVAIVIGMVSPKLLLGQPQSYPLPQSFWLLNGPDIFNSNPGRVGIGVSSPIAKLDVATEGVSSVGLRISDPGGEEILRLREGSSGYAELLMGTITTPEVIRLTADGTSWFRGGDLRVDGAQFDITTSGPSSDAFRILDPGGAELVLIREGSSGYADMYLGTTTDPEVVHLNAAGNSWFRGGDLLVENGKLRAKTLELTGGSDVAELFSMETADSPAPGSVLCISSAGDGSLRLSSTPYDSGVAGVVSGAGEVNAGILLQQAPHATGDVRVAVSGRAYVRCTTENGGIEPGDLLTTAPSPGHAMRASDRERSFGAVLGKALTRLDDEQRDGLVLVLVNLQ